MYIGQILAIAFICLSAFPTPFGNFISITEVLAGFFLLLRVHFSKSTKKLSILALISSTGILISSLIFGDLSDFLGSIWRILSIILLVLFFTELINFNIIHVKLLLLTTSIVYAASVFVFRGELFNQNFWKYGLSTPIIVIVLLLMSHFRLHFLVSFTVLILLSLFSLKYEARGVALICFLTSLNYLSVWNNRKKIKNDNIRIKRVILLTLVVFIFSQLVISIYANQVLKGTFGVSQRSKWIAQNQTGSQSFIFMARPELPVSLCILGDSMLLGRGSSVKIDENIISKCSDFASQLGVSLNINELNRIFPNSTNFNSHSILFSYLTKGGITGGIFWLYLLYIIGKYLFESFAIYRKESAYVFLGITLFADILFSPFTERSNLMLATLIIILFENEKSKKN